MKYKYRIVVDTRADGVKLYYAEEQHDITLLQRLYYYCPWRRCKNFQNYLEKPRPLKQYNEFYSEAEADDFIRKLKKFRKMEYERNENLKIVSTDVIKEY